MNDTHRWVLSLLGTALFSCAAARSVVAQPAASISELGIEAYIYGYPLVTMEMTRRVMTNVAEIEGTRGPMGRFVNLTAYPTADFRDVTAPNADTLYSSAWLDVGREPVIVSFPDEADRYFLMPMLSGWTDVFAVPGKRTTGTGAKQFAITGPGWQGTLPAGVEELKSPTALVWILGRTYCTGTPDDYRAVHAIQAQLSIVPLSAYGKDYVAPSGTVDPSIDMKTPVRDQVHRLDATAFFTLLSKLLKHNPPAAADAPLIAKLAALGIVPGKDFDPNRLDPTQLEALKAVPEAAQAKILGHFKAAGTNQNGWLFTTHAGVYGTDYLQRALITAIGLGANRPQDAVYPTSEQDPDGKPYDGAQRYVMHFPPGQTPPVQGFWSLTMYDGNYFFVDNPLNRYTLSPRNDLRYNDDGSLDLYIQNVSPGPAHESNWLPAPPGKFILMLRLYWPRESKPSILDGSWTPPGVKPVR